MATLKIQNLQIKDAQDHLASHFLLLKLFGFCYSRNQHSLWIHGNWRKVWLFLANAKKCKTSIKFWPQVHIFFKFSFTSLSSFFTHIEKNQSVGGAKTGVPGEKPPDTPASRTWLVPHVTRAPSEARTHSGEMIEWLRALKSATTGAATSTHVWIARSIPKTQHSEYFL